MTDRDPLKPETWTLEDWERRLVSRGNRLARLIELRAPAWVIHHEAIMIAEAHAGWCKLTGLTVGVRITDPYSLDLTATKA